MSLNFVLSPNLSCFNPYLFILFLHFYLPRLTLNSIFLILFQFPLGIMKQAREFMPFPTKFYHIYLDLDSQVISIRFWLNINILHCQSYFSLIYHTQYSDLCFGPEAIWLELWTCNQEYQFHTILHDETLTNVKRCQIFICIWA